MRSIVKKIVCIFFIGIFLVSFNTSAIKITNNPNIIKNIDQTQNTKTSIITTHDYSKDIEPFADLEITVTIKEIRAYDQLDAITDPDFYVKLIINGEKFQSDIWRNQKYVKEEWSKTVNIPEDQEWVDVQIQLWDWDPGFDQLCDISNNYNGNFLEDYYVDLEYNTKNGHWFGADEISFDKPSADVSGYGRLNGCDDNTYNRNNRDCELFFDITQSDPDGDGIPSWTEEKFFGTNPLVDDSGLDVDNDSIPIEWEYKWGHAYFRWHGNVWEDYVYDPFEWNDHKNIDHDNDGLDNVEEYLTSQWGSDPFRQDIFLELDEMEKNGDKGTYVPQLAKEMFRDAFGKHNIYVAIDDYIETEMTGGELIPFQNTVNAWEEAKELRDKYFLNRDPNNWRRGIFRYGLWVYECEGVAGFAFSGNDGYTDSFLIKTAYADEMSSTTIGHILNTKNWNKADRTAQVYAGIMMHESGHVLGIHRGNTPGCDNRDTYVPTQFGWWKWANYKSAMNYRYVMEIVDYSDGSHGKNDFDDWARIDLPRFQN
jgi:hypothetical protein